MYTSRPTAKYRDGQKKSIKKNELQSIGQNKHRERVTFGLWIIVKAFLIFNDILHTQKIN